ncbi:MAG TPA: PAS domain S-box protein [Anaeromyxobacteraceae bacterium]|nr:PAS domain S-box protein [Anaeromyxobacteraceae bacterium]
MAPVRLPQKERERMLALELRRTQALLERLIDSSPDAVVACDLTGRVVLFNKAAEVLTGYTAAEAIAALEASQLYVPGVPRELVERMRGSGSGLRVEGYRTEVIPKAGGRVPVLLAASLLEEDGEEMAWVAILVDQRERIDVEKRLATAEEKLKEREKQAMIAELAGAAAHELNQPLTSVMGYADLLRRRVPPGDPSARPVEIIYREAERMAEIVRKIGRITRYETTTYMGKVRIVDIDKATDE